MNVAVYLVVAAATTLLSLVGLSAGAQWLLGVRIGRLRAMVTGCVGITVMGVVGVAMLGEQSQGDENRLALLTVQFGCTLLATMVFLALSEVVLPSGSLRGALHLIHSLRRRVARTRRYTQLTGIAARHGLGRFLRGRRWHRRETMTQQAQLARSLRLALEDAGTTFVKLGQVLSTRYDLLPAAFADELGRLQHQVTPDPWPGIEQVLTEELGAEPAAVFATFETKPMAAGSIAQVHRARLVDGQQVVVKVQRPGARQIVERDLDIVFRLSREIERHTDWGRTMGVTNLAAGFAAALNEELDFRVEARNTAAIAATLPADDGKDSFPGVRPLDPRLGALTRILVPAVHEQLTTQRVLVLQQLDGITLNAAGPAIDERGLDRAALARRLLECLLNQIMTGGVFHADPHPGNILLLADNSLALLDFGSVGRIDRLVRSALGHLLLAIHRNDPAALCDALLDLVNRSADVDIRGLERALGQFMARHLTPGVRPDRETFTDLFSLVACYGLTVPQEVAGAFRALATLEGALGGLVPGFDIITESRAFAEANLTGIGSPSSARAALADEALAMLPILRRIPHRIERITGALEDGRLSVSVRLLADERDRRFIRGLVHDALLSFLGCALAAIGVMLINTSGGPRISSSVQLFAVGGYNLLVIGSILVLRVLFTIFRAPR